VSCASQFGAGRARLGGVPSGTYRTVRGAVARRASLVATYDGYERQLSPHVVGFAAGGAERALCYQYGGDTSSGPVTARPEADRWRCFDLARLEVHRVVEDEFRTGPREQPTQTCVRLVDLTVDLDG
jgi:hypothetical protein